MPVTVTDLLVKFSANTSGAERGFDQMDKRVGQFQKSNSGMLAGLASVGKVAAGTAVAGLVALGGAMVATAVSGFQMAADVEAQMDTIASVLGKTEEEAKPLSDLIMQLGINPNLKVSTLEAADAIETLATAGLSMEQIIGGAAEATILLANATGGDFALSAEIMTHSMAMFKDSITDYGDAVNGVVAVSNVSTFGVEDFAGALAAAGGVASAVGVEYDDFTATIAAIAPAFASGADAGTSYKTFLSSLVPTSKPAIEAMMELGLMTEDGTNKFYDQNGALKSGAEIAALLQGALGDLSEEELNLALKTMFGSDASRAANAIMESGAVAYTDAATAAAALGVSQEEVNKVIAGGVTQFEALQLQMAKTDSLDAAKQRIDNASGAMDVLAGVVQAVQFGIGNQFLPVMKELAISLTTFVSENQPAITAFFSSFAQWLGDTAKTAIPAFLAGIAAIISAIQVFAGGISVIEQYIRTGELLSATEFGMSEQTAALVDSFTELIANIVDTVAAVGTFIQPLIDAIAQFVSWKDVLTVLGIAIALVVIPAIAGFVAAVAPIAATMAGLVLAVAALRTAWETDWGGIRTHLEESWPAMKGNLDLLNESLLVTIPGSLISLQESWKTTWDANSANLTGNWGVMLESFTLMQTWLTVTLKAAFTGFQTFLAGLNLPNPFTVLATALGGLDGLIASVKGSLTDFSNWIGGLSISNPFAGWSMPSIPGFAGGTNFAPGGLAWVGEQGPELVALPRGSQVFDSGESKRMSDDLGESGAQPISISISQTFTGRVNADEVRAASQDGVLAAMRSLGMRVG